MLRVMLSLLLLCLAENAWGDEPALDPKRVQQVRAMYSKLPGEILGVQEPIVVVDVKFTRIPLAAIVIVKDARGQQLFIRRDNGLQTKTPEAIYLSPVAAFKQESLLATRGPEEAAIYGLLLRWQEQELKKPDDKRLDRWTLEDAEHFLLRFDQQYAGDPPRDTPDIKP